MADDNRDQGQGQGNFGNPEQHAKAGKLGGEKTAATQDREFYEEIGSEGGKNSPTNFKNRPTEEVQEIGRKGGQSSGSNQDS